MILQNSTYILYRLDLDKFNTKGKTNKEFYNTKKDRLSFIEVVRYDESQVNYKALSTMVIRGSSKKEIINLNEIEYIFLLHDNEIYYFSET